MALKSFVPRLTADTTQVTADRTTPTAVSEMRRRIVSLLPPGWFATSATPIKDAVVAGLASSFLWIRSLNIYAQAQTRLGTATGYWLDIAAWDFFGNRLLRRRGEADTALRGRVLKKLFRPRVTRAALVESLTDLTGIAPDVFEPWNPGDCGAYNTGTLAYGGPADLHPVLTGYGEVYGGYGVGSISYGQPPGTGARGGGSGAYGSLSLPNQVFVTVHRPPPQFPTVSICGGYGVGVLAYGGGRDGVPALYGYGSPEIGYGSPAGSYGRPTGPYEHFTGSGYYQSLEEQTSIADAEIYDAITTVIASGTVAWTRIQGP